MSYPYSYNSSGAEVTKREMFVSAIFMLLAFIAGVCIAGSIRSCENDANVKYYQAVKIADSTQFNYAFKTNAGHTLAYGTVAAVGYVTDEGIGNYMTLTRVLEEYRKHHRTVCSGEGKNRHCHTETYWSWDAIGRDRFAVSQVRFLGKNFYYHAFPELPGENYVGIVKLPTRGFFSNKQRYVYYGRELSYTGTIYANIDNHQFNDAKFLNGENLDTAVECLIHKWGVPVFWVVFGILVIVLVVLFVAMPNEWLYGKFWRQRKKDRVASDNFWDNFN